MLLNLYWKGRIEINAQANVGGKDRLQDDDGGHLIGAQFNGSPNIDNLVSQNSQINRKGVEFGTKWRLSGPMHWKRYHLTFELTSNGKFNIDYNYRNIENDDSYVQQIIWEYEKLNIILNENRQRDFKIIEEYKKNINNNIK